MHHNAHLAAYKPTHPERITKPVLHHQPHAPFSGPTGFSFPNYLDKLFGTYEDGTKFMPQAKDGKVE
jgi:hypothetical protein